ncbi:MAG: hypothetical protein P8R54_25435 [Myxococcota bacterium]|nr:hypothetical protein [Myxococcota bacterium]
MSILANGSSAVVLLLITGCSPEFSDYAELSADSETILIDINCDTDTCSGDAVGFTLALSEHLAWGSDGEAEFLQYRVDYALESGDIGYFADDLSLTVAPGGSIAFELALVGSSQRSEIGITTQTTASGEATVTLAGYDPTNSSVQVSATVPVEFQDVIGNATDTTLDSGLSAN